LTLRLFVLSHQPQIFLRLHQTRVILSVAKNPRISLLPLPVLAVILSAVKDDEALEPATALRPFSTTLSTVLRTKLKQLAATR
jgi:hypothetical protein